MSTTVDTNGIDPVADAALTLAKSVAQGEITLATVEQAAADRCKALFGTVAGEGDVLWPLHVDVCRQAIALGALSASELGQWTSVIRQREGRSH